MPFRSIVVTGPLLAPRRRDAIIARLSRVSHDVDIVEFTDRMEQLVADAAAVVSMADTTRSSRPSPHARRCCSSPREVPRREQAVRASRLSTLPGVDVCPIGALGDDRLAAFVTEALAAPSPRSPAPIELGGLDRLAAEVEALLRRRYREISGLREVRMSLLATRPRKVGYVLKKYPRLSETFVLNELLGLERLGVDLTVYSLRLPDDGRFHADLARLHAPVRYLPPFNSNSVLDAIRASPARPIRSPRRRPRLRRPATAGQPARARSCTACTSPAWSPTTASNICTFTS